MRNSYFRACLLITALMFVLLHLSTQQNRFKHDSSSKLLAVVDLAEDSYRNVRKLYDICKLTRSNDSSERECHCDLADESKAYFDISRGMLDISLTKYQASTHRNDVQNTSIPRDCMDILISGQEDSGVYTVQPASLMEQNKTLDVYCDMDTAGGGWTVLQRRDNFTLQENFFRGWDDYKIGFGNISKDFWIGNENIYTLTDRAPSQTLRFDLEDANGERRFAVYKNFRIDGEDRLYELHIGEYRGNAGDSFTYNNGQKFSTLYKKNDAKRNGIDCAVESMSGWWFNKCSLANPNGLYDPGKNDSVRKYIKWDKWKGREGLKFVDMKIRRY